MRAPCSKSKACVSSILTTISMTWVDVDKKEGRQVELKRCSGATVGKDGSGDDKPFAISAYEFHRRNSDYNGSEYIMQSLFVL